MNCLNLTNDEQHKNLAPIKLWPQNLKRSWWLDRHIYILFPDQPKAFSPSINQTNERETDQRKYHSHHISLQIKDDWSYPSTAEFFMVMIKFCDGSCSWKKVNANGCIGCDIA